MTDAPPTTATASGGEPAAHMLHLPPRIAATMRDYAERTRAAGDEWFGKEILGTFDVNPDGEVSWINFAKVGEEHCVKWFGWHPHIWHSHACTASLAAAPPSPADLAGTLSWGGLHNAENADRSLASECEVVASAEGLYTYRPSAALLREFREAPDPHAQCVLYEAVDVYARVFVLLCASGTLSIPTFLEEMRVLRFATLVGRVQRNEEFLEYLREHESRQEDGALRCTWSSYVEADEKDRDYGFDIEFSHYPGPEVLALTEAEDPAAARSSLRMPSLPIRG